MRSNYQFWWESVKSLNCMICNYGLYTIQGKGDTFMVLLGYLKIEMANFEIRINQGKNVSCSQGVHFQFIGDKVKNYVLPKNKIYVLPKSEIYVLAKRKTELQTPIVQPSSLESHVNNIAT